MALNTPFYPYATTNAAGSFSVSSGGLIVGTAYNDPSARFALAGGTLATTETLPMWGGVAISENVPVQTVDGTTGGTIGRAASVGNITGFSVFDQAYSWVSSPQSTVPTAGAAGMTVPFYRLGSGARIAVAMDPSLVSLGGGLITQNVSWDFNNQCLQPYDASTATVSITSQTASFANGVYTIAVVAAAASNVGAVGDFINISGATNSGTGGNSLVNGNFSVTSFTDNQHFSYQVTAASGAIATIAGSAVLNEGTGLLPVKVLSFNNGNSKIVSYNAATGAANWIGSGSAAIILL